MKNLVFILSFFAFLSCTSNQTEKKSSVDITKLVKAEINVKGMTCTGCENTINEKVHSVKGVENANSSHTEGKTWVTYDTTSTDIDAILYAIDETGYKADGYKLIKDKVN